MSFRTARIWITNIWINNYSIVKMLNLYIILLCINLYHFFLGLSITCNAFIACYIINYLPRCTYHLLYSIYLSIQLELKKRGQYDLDKSLNYPPLALAKETGCNFGVPILPRDVLIWIRKICFSGVVWWTKLKPYCLLQHIAINNYGCVGPMQLCSSYIMVNDHEWMVTVNGIQT